MQYGYFDDPSREYVINQPNTPLPWINYLGSEDYFGIISNLAGGYSFYQDARLRRLTRYRYNNVPRDMGGRYIYLRDNAGGGILVTHLDVNPESNRRLPLSAWVGLHNHWFKISRHSRRCALFCSRGETLEIWDMTIKNTTQKEKELSAFSNVEFCMWDAHDDLTNFQRNLNIGEMEVEGSVIYHKTEYRERRNHFAYFACSEPIVGFETQQEAFLGSY
jgi:cellobiose phosphorylase